MDAVNVHMLLRSATDDDIFYPFLPRLRRERKYEYLNRSPKPKIRNLELLQWKKHHHHFCIILKFSFILSTPFLAHPIQS